MAYRCRMLCGEIRAVLVQVLDVVYFGSSSKPGGLFPNGVSHQYIIPLSGCMLGLVADVAWAAGERILCALSKSVTSGESRSA